MRCTKYPSVAARSLAMTSVVLSIPLRAAGLLLLLSPSTVASRWPSTTSQPIHQVLDRVGRGPIVAREQGAFSEGNLHFREVSSSGINGLIQLLIACLTLPRASG